MERRLARLLALSLAFAWVWLAPSWARAAFVPVCDAQATATTVSPAPEPVCAIVKTVDDATGATSAAPICDPRGASAIAPQRLLPVSDARLDASPGCGEDPNATAVAPRRGGGPGGTSAFACGELGVFTDPLAPLARPVFRELPDERAQIGAPRHGVRRGVYHPPR